MIKAIRGIVSFAIFLIYLTLFVFLPALIGNFLSSFSLFQGAPLIIRALTTGGTAAVIIAALFLLLTLLFGRLYCSFLCPLGAFQDFFIMLSGKYRKLKGRYTISMPLFRYFITITAIGLFVTVSPVLFTLLEPFSFFGRISGLLIRPGGIAFANGLSRLLENFNIYLTPPVIPKISSFHILSILITTGLIAYAAFIKGRIYCNTLCPVGSVLGAISRFALYNPRINPETCTACGICEKGCRAECISSKHYHIDLSRCVSCFDCISRCPHGAVKYTRKSAVSRQAVSADAVSGAAISENTFNQESLTPLPQSIATHQTITRRYFIKQGSAIGAVLLLTAGVPSAAGAFLGREKPRFTPIIPPGAESLKRFISRCTGCGMCMQVCPTGVIAYSKIEERSHGILQANLRYSRAFCEYECNACTRVCPSGALNPLTVKKRQQTKIGEVNLNKDLCVVFDKYQACGACAEHCPTGAVRMEPYILNLSKPVIQPEYCIGCGHCEYVCPTRPIRAITVEGLVAHEPRKIRPEETKEGKDKASKAEKGSKGFAF